MATNNLLVPAAQKFYSALVNLQRFKKQNDFFDNISSLDSFLSEYRNVTFVIQKSLSHTDFMPIYEELRNKYFSDDLSKWFVEKRNEILKEHPFQLQKQVFVTIYDNVPTLRLTSKLFTAEADADYKSLIEDLRDFLRINNPIETSFSVEFVYKEISTDENLFDKLLQGISTMYSFILDLNERIGDSSDIFDDIMKKIDSLPILRANTTDLFVDDYVYYADKDEFESGARLEFRLPEIRVPINSLSGMNIPLDNLGFSEIKDKLYRLFLRIILSHSYIYIKQKHHIMPTFFIVYDDDTLLLHSFDSSLRSTLYRKINEIGDRIIASKGRIKAIILINEMWGYKSIEVFKKNYKDRISTENPTVLFTGHMIDKSRKTVSYHLEGDKMDSSDYVLDQLKKGPNSMNELLFMNPIYKAFDFIDNPPKMDNNETNPAI